MPEGDTLFLTAAGLRPRLVGRELRSVRPSTFAGLAGRRVESVEAQGKHLLIALDDGRVIHSHLGMKGSWHAYRPGERWRIPERQSRLVLVTDDWLAVLFRPQLVEVRQLRQLGLERLGPDILAPDFDAAAVVARARASDRREVGDLLLDQRVCAGIGNIYKCESLWRRKLDPWTDKGVMSDAELGALYLEARGLMLASAAGGFQRRAVHGRGGRACPRCNAGIKVRPQGAHARLTYYCPGCQLANGGTAPPV